MAVMGSRTNIEISLFSYDPENLQPRESSTHAPNINTNLVCSNKELKTDQTLTEGRVMHSFLL